MNLKRSFWLKEEINLKKILYKNVITDFKKKTEHDFDEIYKQKVMEEYYNHPFCLLFFKKASIVEKVVLLNDSYFFDKPLVLTKNAEKSLFTQF